MATIDVRGSRLGHVPALGDYYHMYIIYTDDNGHRTVLRGGPSSQPNDIEFSEVLAGQENTTFGNVRFDHAPYEVINGNEPPDWDPQNTDPRTTVWSGTDAQGSQLLNQMVERGNQINQNGIGYNPVYTNSNSTVTELLESANIGFNAPKDAQGDEIWAPGGGNDLPNDPTGNHILDIFKNYFDWATEKGGEIASDVYDFFDDTLKDATEATDGFIDDLLNMVDDVLNGFEENDRESDSQSLTDSILGYLNNKLNELGEGSTELASPDDQSGFTGLWCCVAVDPGGHWVAYESSDALIDNHDTNGKTDIFIYQLKPFVYALGSIQRVSIGYDGQEGNGDSFNPTFSTDGYNVAFTSFASNLVVNDTNNALDVFLTGIDRYSERISVNSAGEQGNGASYFASVSDMANQVAFVSDATNLVATDTNGVSDIFLRNRLSGTTEIISKGPVGAQANGTSTMPSISQDGNKIAFVSAATNLVAGDTNAKQDIFVFNRSTNATERISVSASGTQANGDSWSPVMTPDGKFVAFFSNAANLIAGDTNAKQDIFLANLETHAIERVSVGLGGAQSNGDSGGTPITGPEPGNSWGVAVSADGRYVSFISSASNLVANDTNAQTDTFLYDRVSHTTVRLNVSASGAQASGGLKGSAYAGAVAMSGDASVVAYISDATNLSVDDQNSQPDVFVYKANEPVTTTLGVSAPETINGAEANDMLAGFSGNDELHGNNGGDMLYGGSGDDTLYGDAGDDKLNGGEGIDRLVGGQGDDVYTLESTSDIIVENPQSGLDTVQVAFSYTLTGNIERLNLLGSANINGTGNNEDNQIFGNEGNNMIRGSYGDDILSGLAGNDEIYGEAGNDRLSGAEGNDTLYGGTGSDTNEGGLGTDSILGNEGDDSLVGNEDADTLLGGAGSDTLDGGIGSVDSLAGGDGNDLYIIGETGEAVTELRNQGTDTIESSITFTLSDNIETLRLTGTANINGTGNNLSNTLYGNSGGNVLDGKAGYDQMFGGLGNDTYYSDGNDYAYEAEGEGTDIVISSGNYSLGAAIEKLTLSGSNNTAGYGNELNNTIVGSAGDNTIDGYAGNDRMEGGNGDDVYYADSASDVIVENANAGYDEVISAATLTIGANVEALTLAEVSTALNATGNTLNNVLSGNSLANVFNGAAGNDTILGFAGADKLTGGDGNDSLDGGDGKDTMTGGKGDDTYVVSVNTDSISELASEGNDAVRSAVSYTLGANLESLELIGFGNFNATGNALANLLTGNDYDNVLNGAAGADTMEGGYGNDTFTVDNAGDIVTEGANAGTDKVNSSINYTLRTNVENLTLTGTTAATGTGNTLDNFIVGNAIANTLSGGAGNDTLDGGLGTDRLVGGDGSDLYKIDVTADVIVEARNQGIDTVESAVTYTLGENIEAIRLTGASNVNATGNNLSNSLYGNSGNNALDGKAGYDQMYGGLGDDTYYSDGSDFVYELDGEGSDLVISSGAYSLGAAIEKLTLTGDANSSGYGNELNNTIIGGLGDNTIDGSGGNDRMEGGAGDDTFYINSALDIVVEKLNEGYDEIMSNVSITLSANVEGLTLLELDTALNGTGNAVDNLITGNSYGNTIAGDLGNDTLLGLYGNDSLNGGDGADSLDGGDGADTMLGGAGDDIYTLDASTDSVIELANEGYDLVKSNVTYILGANLEAVALVGFGNFNATGNALNNSLAGNDYDNTLDGGGGADTMEGNYGNDTYIVNDAGDSVLEGLYNGIDTVRSSINYTLGEGVENLVLTGSALINGTGSSLADSLTGNSAKNILTGAVGSDTLTGGGGADVFMYNNLDDSRYETGGLDHIMDFSNSQTDKINVSAIDANISASGNQAFSFIGTAGFTAAAQARVTYSDGDAYVEFNVNTTLDADMIIIIENATSVAAGWFVL